MLLPGGDLPLIDAYWRAANYLSVGQIYLLDNPLLREPLTPAHIKPRLLGHWGTSPGLNFIYVHLNRLITECDVRHRAGSRRPAGLSPEPCGGIAEMAAALGGIDVLCFTGGVGERAPAIREGCALRLGFLGVAIDPERYLSSGGDLELSAIGAGVRTLRLRAREDLEMARKARELLRG